MCGRKFGRGSRITAVALVFLLVALSPLSAWAWSNAKTSSPAPASSAVSQEQIQSLKELIGQLESQLTAQEQMLQNSQASLRTAELKAAQLSREIVSLKGLLGVSETSSTTLKADYDALKADYDLKVDENSALYRELVSARGKIPSAWGGSIGAGAVYNPSTGKIGAELSMGVSFRQWSLEIGAGYSPDVWVLEVPDFSKMDYKAGLRFSY